MLVKLILFMGCGIKGDDSGNKPAMGLQVVVMNSCQYVLHVSSHSSTMVHAGNCNNPYHKTHSHE